MATVNGLLSKQLKRFFSDQNLFIFHAFKTHVVGKIEIITVIVTHT